MTIEIMKPSSQYKNIHRPLALLIAGYARELGIFSPAQIKENFRAHPVIDEDNDALPLLRSHF